MKRIICLAMLLTFFAAAATSQESEKPKKIVSSKFFYFGTGIGFGFFYPTDINNLLEERYDEYTTELGFSAMIMYFDFNVFGSFFINRYLELQVVFEAATAPKVMVRGETTDSYLLSRLSPEIKFNTHIPLGQRFSYYLGIGSSYNLIKFSGTNIATTSAYTPGFSIQNGVMVRFRKFAIEPFIEFKYINSDLGSIEHNAIDYDNPFGDFGIVNKLSYSGGQIGCKFLF